MTFQSTVRFDLASYIVGEIVFDGPLRVEPKLTASTLATNNVFGRAFQQVAANDDEVTADLGSESVFAGILVNPKENVTSGTASGTLEPTLTLLNGEQASFLKEGTIAVEVTGTQAVAIGDEIFYNFSTGILLAQTPGGTAPTGYATNSIGKVVRNSVAASSERIVVIHVFG